jgi:hypothetical protein
MMGLLLAGYQAQTKQARPKLAHIGRAETVTAAGTGDGVVTMCCFLVSVGRGDRIRIESCALRVHVDGYLCHRGRRSAAR